MTGRRVKVWDLLVLGGGTAGIVGAKTAASLGADVLMVERERPGGDCLWTGCVPSKSLLAAASHVAGARRGAALGVDVEDVRVDFARVMTHVRASIAAIEPVDTPEALREAGVEVLQGTGRFTGPGTVDVDGREERFHQALVVTGASPAVPAVPGLREAEPLTSETVWDLKELPGRLVVMGGGTIGVELGQAFARLGSEVTLVESLPRILGREDPDASALVRDALVADGVRLLTGHSVVAVDGTPSGGTVTVDGGDGRLSLPYDALLVAVGRRPRSFDLGLGRADVAVTEQGFIQVEETLRTTNPRIWAAGDVTPNPQFTHVAGAHASLAASNAVLGLRRAVDRRALPRVTFTDPEVASVGTPTWSDDGRAPRTVTRRHSDVDRAVTEDRRDGFARLALDRRHRVTGATVVGPRAGESLAEVTLAIRKGLSVSDLASTVHAYPTYADGPWNAALVDVRERLQSPAVRQLTAAAVRVRRAWLSRRT